MNILFLSGWYPYPPDNGSKLRIYNLIRGLAQRHEVTLISFASRLPDATPRELAAVCSTVHVVPQREYHPTSARALFGFFSPKPRVVVDIYQPEMAERIREAIARNRFDLIVASQWETAAYYQAFADTPAIFEEVELGVFDSKRAQAPTPLHRLRHELPLLKLRAYLARMLQRFGACTVVSESERQLLQRVVPRYPSVRVIPNGIDLRDYADVRCPPVPNTLIFTGAFRYFANHDAMQWFLSEAYPRIQANIPEVSLTITGDHADKPLPAARNVTLTGFVDDVRPHVASAWASVAPIRVGGGTRLKILEAMALRTPVVATSKGAEGLGARHDEHLLFADTGPDFADAVIRLLKDPELRRRIADGGYRLVSEKFEWSAIMPRVLSLADEVVLWAAQKR